MTRDEQLRARLQAADPLRARHDVDPLPPASTAEIRERVMQTINQPDNVTPVPTTNARKRWQVLAVAAAAALVTISAAAVVWLAGGQRSDTGNDPTTLSLKVPSSGVMASCVGFSVEYLRNMPVAFAGTATTVSTDEVVLEVDRWYKGGTAEQVRVSRPDPRSSIALDGVEFVQGKRYLVTATDGTVNGCGFSGEATPDLENAFTEAFPG